MGRPWRSFVQSLPRFPLWKVFCRRFGANRAECCKPFRSVPHARWSPAFGEGGFLSNHSGTGGKFFEREGASRTAMGAESLAEKRLLPCGEECAKWRYGAG